MTPLEIGKYYNKLTNGEKGRFTAFISLRLGGSPHTWQQKILGWSHNKLGKPLSPVIENSPQSLRPAHGEFNLNFLSIKV